MSQAVSLVAHPLHANRPTELAREERSLESGVVRRGAAERLGAVHPDHTNAVARHAEKLGHAIAKPVRLHVVGVDGQIAVGGIRGRVRGPERRVTLKRKLVIGLDDLCGTEQGSVDVAGLVDDSARGRRGRAHVVEQVVRGGKGRGRRAGPFDA